MTELQPIYTLLYGSNLAPNASAGDIATLARVSRTHNSEHHITGILLFDGRRFIQYLEGPQSSVLKLIQRIAADTRHVDFLIRHQGPDSSPRRFPSWSLGYAMAKDGYTFDAFDKAWGDETVTLLMRILPQCELEP